MPASIKDFAGLKSLQKDLKSKDEARKAAQEIAAELRMREL